jgi:hypothetical protein
MAQRAFFITGFDPVRLELARAIDAKLQIAEYLTPKAIVTYRNVLKLLDNISVARSGVKGKNPKVKCAPKCGQRPKV